MKNSKKERLIREQQNKDLIARNRKLENLKYSMNVIQIQF